MAYLVEDIIPIIMRYKAQMELEDLVERWELKDRHITDTDVAENFCRLCWELDALEHIYYAKSRSSEISRNTQYIKSIYEEVYRDYVLDTYGEVVLSGGYPDR